MRYQKHNTHDGNGCCQIASGCARELSALPRIPGIVRVPSSCYGKQFRAACMQGDKGFVWTSSSGPQLTVGMQAIPRRGPHNASGWHVRRHCICARYCFKGQPCSYVLSTEILNFSCLTSPAAQSARCKKVVACKCYCH